MRKSIGVMIVALLFMIMPYNRASAALVTADYTFSGTPGNYLLDFTFGNNIPAVDGQYVYFMGVDLAHDPAQGSPNANWVDAGTWNNFQNGYGGSNIDYSGTWINEQFNTGIASGASLSGFTVHTALIPDTIHYFAFAYDNSDGPGYFGNDAFLTGHNPGFEGVVAPPGGQAAVPEPGVFSLLSLGLLGLGFKLKRKRDSYEV